MGRGKIARAVWVGVLCAMTAAAPAHAQRCWNQTLVEAAQVKEYDVMLMVATLRCQAKGVDFSSTYNSFVLTHKPILKAVGDEMIRELNTSLGGKAALKAYDSMSVTMANKYGRGIDGLECSDFQIMLTEAQASRSTRADLLALAQRAGADPVLPAPRCAPPMQTAAATN
ncbi:hypothetical protein [Sphingobium nicotianae]|uniref:DUF5333 domain-containing protein n=1 Tax=Sphingobium nicotianae TaxID=2782607 RepID=A0A9X1DDX8_9SPHN|nr:hypothetical protein [Sphingobium nicotianae]MBT2187773.1 hypothetical protein [Sphingobium nicotianae]